MLQSQAEERCRVERIRTLAQQVKVGTRMAIAATGILGLLIVPGVGWGSYAACAAAMAVVFLGSTSCGKGACCSRRTPASTVPAWLARMPGSMR
ncbi:MAG: hypothetical protein H0W40_01610 [Methylibium sp.]|uniref:hypothetical protein n=1 Tax=Methylibium sp. TaxID=2067992 RepID=UPI0017DD6EEC|nr:hypothetical protein [Methylibium sp.]MBA3596065.1 hypothetical protein [Methylibium sp.]